MMKVCLLAITFVIPTKQTNPHHQHIYECFCSTKILQLLISSTPPTLVTTSISVIFEFQWGCLNQCSTHTHTRVCSSVPCAHPEAAALSSVLHDLNTSSTTADSCITAASSPRRFYDHKKLAIHTLLQATHNAPGGLSTCVTGR